MAVNKVENDPLGLIISIIMPGAIVFAFIFTCWFIWNFFLRTKKKENGSKKKKRYRPLKHRFKASQSPLEIVGELVSPWDTIEMTELVEPFRGWYTLSILFFLWVLFNPVVQNGGDINSLIVNRERLRDIINATPKFAAVIVSQYILCYQALIVQKLLKNGFISFHWTARIPFAVACHVYNFSLLGIGCYVTLLRPQWPFTQRLAILLQSMVFYMKMHSYFSVNYLLWCRSHEIKKNDDEPKDKKATPDSPMSKEEKEFTEEEERKKNIYPKNVCTENFVNYTMVPTLCYETEYPKTNKVRGFYILEKAMIAAGLILLLWNIVNRYIKPILSNVGDSPAEMSRSIFGLIGPMMMCITCGFFLIFDCILNALAEISRFADRRFYKDFWNSTTFLEFSRKWNVPVHEFLLRHFYVDGIQVLGLSPFISKIITFVVSIALHELLLCCLFRMFAPWLTIFSILQFPLMAIMKAPVFKGKALGNFIFWIGLSLGIPMIMVLYVFSCRTSSACMSIGHL